MLFGAAALALLGSTAAACGSPPPPPEVDELAAQLDRARADSKLATDAAVATPPPPTAQALTAVASERAAQLGTDYQRYARAAVAIGKRAAASSECAVRRQWQDVARAAPAADKSTLRLVTVGRGLGTSNILPLPNGSSTQ